MARGASDYLFKGVGRRELISTITAAAAGKSPIQSGELLRLANLMASNAPSADEDVRPTSRESQVLRHVALGLSNNEIANSLTICLDTVKEHVQNILRKLAVTDRTQAAVWAVRRAWSELRASEYSDATEVARQ